MKKFFGIGLALMLCFTLVVPAMATDQGLPDPVNQPSQVAPTVTKNISIEETLMNSADMELVGYFDKWKMMTIDTYKHINVDITTEIGVDSDGEAETFGTQLNTENVFKDDERPGTPGTTESKTIRDKTVVTGNNPGDPPVPNVRTADITSSVDGNNGVVGVNQSPGNMNNQANLAAMAVIAAEAQLIEANGFAVQASLFNELYSYGSENTNTIDTSINNNNGIVGINQSAGNMNNQFNSAAMAAGLNDVTTGALGEATLKQVSADSFLRHVAVYRADTITGSITGNAGVVSVNQASGDMVNQANVCAIAARLE